MAYQVTASKHGRTTRADVADNKTKLILPAKNFIFAQASIVSSVMVEDQSYLIKPETAYLVNENGDTWSNESLKANYRSFIGGYNYVNHVQEPEKAVGFLADAVLRRVLLDQEENIFVYYVDLLIATSREAHPELVGKILAEKISYLSMGCTTYKSTCSVCGHVAEDEVEFCDHLTYQKGKHFIDKRGVKRITAEILGTEEPGSCDFYEASWLTEVPAFGGACKRNLLPIPEDQSVEILMEAPYASKPAVKQFTGG